MHHTRQAYTPLCGFNCCCRPLWSRLHDLPPLDYQDPALLETDPDLVLQEGPDALPFECMRPFLNKWRGLVDVWNGGWRDLLKVRGLCTWTCFNRDISGCTVPQASHVVRVLVCFTCACSSRCSCLR